MSLLMSSSSQEKGIAVTTAAPPEAVAVEFPASTDVEAIGMVVTAGALDGSSALLEDEELESSEMLELALLSARALVSTSVRELTASVLGVAEFASTEAVATADARIVAVEVKVLVSVCRMMLRIRTPTVVVFSASASFRISAISQTHHSRNSKGIGHGRGRLHLLARASRNQPLFSSQPGGSLGSSCGSRCWCSACNHRVDDRRGNGLNLSSSGNHAATNGC